MLGRVFDDITTARFVAARLRSDFTDVELVAVDHTDQITWRTQSMPRGV